MKKLFSLLVMGLFLISMVSAALTNVADEDVEKRNIDGGRGPSINNTSDLEDVEDEALDTEDVEDEAVEETEKKSQNGALNQVRENVQEKVMAKVQIGEKQIDSEVEVETDFEGKVKAKLSNGRNVTVKVMPETASEKAIQALSLHNCRAEDGCTIELKEVGNGNETKAAYEVKTQKEVKVLGMFKAKMNVQAQVDAENGEVIKTKKAWWAFLASEDEVETEEVETEAEVEDEVETEDEPLDAINPNSEPTAQEVEDARLV